MRQNVLRPAARLRSVLTVSVLGLALTAGSGQMAATASVAAPATVAPTVARGVVASSPTGVLTSRVVGTTAAGRQVTGEFVPLRFVKRDGKVRVRGLVQGKIGRGETARTFSALRTFTVKSVNGERVTTRTAARTTATAPRAAACDVLNLVLGPLDLDVLGLEVSLNRVVLDIVARSGAGALLGNLLCAVAGLLDGGLAGALGRLTRLLNRVLGQLGLGV